MRATLSKTKWARRSRPSGGSPVVRGITVRRCRPLLGTFVEITVTGTDHEKIVRRIDGAFQKMERIHHLMSVHDPGSELSRVNASALNKPVTISEETMAVLERGLQLARESEGAFDFTIAATLAQWGLLPSHIPRPEVHQGCWSDVVLMPMNRVRFLKPLAIDVGGIAKGFAVDLAIESLRGAGVTSAMVNAGGDLRAFGGSWPAIHLRHPIGLHALLEAVSVSDAALATSSPAVTRRTWRGRFISHLVDPRQGQAVVGDVSVTVRAPECWLADGLTKVVLNDPHRAETLLGRHHAEAFILTA